MKIKDRGHEYTIPAYGIQELKEAMKKNVKIN